MRVYLIIFVLLGGTLLSAQNRFTLSGEITDSETGEDLVGATVYMAETSLGGVSNSYGFYSLTVPGGKQELVCSYIGYEEFRQEIDLGKDKRLNIRLQPKSTQLEEVVVSAERADRNLSSVDIGVEKLDVSSIAKIPVLLGEKDILKTLQLMPGISTISEGSAGFSVRGGSVDQNLILLDESPVYSASHLMGFFSVFNADAIRDVSVFKGGIPANYGGRAASVVDIQMKDGNSRQFSGSGGIGLISSRLTLEGPIVKDKSSFILSGRRSYADLMAIGSGLLESGTSLYFYDLNTKINYRVNDNNRLFLSGYFGKDDFGFGDFGTDWGNATGTLRWNHLFGPRLFANTTFIYSKYTYGFNLEDDLKMSSGIEDFAFKEDLTYFINPGHTLKFGINSTYHSFNPGELLTGDGEFAAFEDIIMEQKQSVESGLYLSSESRFGERFSAEYGLRVSAFHQLGEGWDFSYDEDNQRIDSTWYGKRELMQSYFSLEPRLSMNYRLGEFSALKASYNRITQYLHLLSNSTSGQPTDTWVPSSTNVEPVTVNQFSAGYYRNFLDNNLEFSVEAYYKDMQKVTDYEDGTNVFFNEDIEASILSGDGRSYGLEVYLKKKYGRLTGWISYTLARTEILIPEISSHWYPTAYDKTHDAALVLSYDLTERLSFSGSWIYYTGSAVTFPSGKYEFGGYFASYYTERNGYRMPDYHRLDVNFHLAGKKKSRFKSSWDFSVYNAYNRHNAYLIGFRESESQPGTTEAVKLSLFGIVPSFTWNFEF
ncbi:MAG: TonB-dependent receptor [Bacteroidetes bacterium]|nr:TonB-dependent receptor [Bacteroidota bacterium]